MRLQILTESATLKETPFDIKAKFVVNSKKYSLTSEFDSEISKEFIKNLNIEKIKDVVSLTRPYISTFFDAVLNRDYDTVLDVIYPISSMLVGRYSNTSSVVEELRDVLSISKIYMESVNKFLSFYSEIENDSSIVLSKIQSIYERFKNNRVKILDGLFTAYEGYLNTLKEGKETGKSKEAKQNVYSEYVRSQNIIEDVLDEVASMSPKKTEDSPLKSISGKNYDKVKEFFETNRSDLKKISAKLLYLAYFDDILRNEQGSLYSSSKYDKFSYKKDKTGILSEIKNTISDKIDGEFQVGINNSGFTVSTQSISSIDFPKLAESISGLGESGSFTITFLEMYQEIKTLPEYSFYYVYDEVFGTKSFIESAAKLLDVESIKNVGNILASKPMPEDFELGKYSFEVEGNSIISNSISIKDTETAIKYIKVFSMLKDLNIDEYEVAVKSLVKKLAKNPENTFPINDVLKSLRKNKGDDFNILTYSIIKNAIKDPEQYNDIAYVISHIAYNYAIEGFESNKLFRQLFKKILINNQTEIIDYMIRKSKGDDIKLDKIKEFLLDYENVLTPESLTRLGVTENVQ